MQRVGVVPQPLARPIAIGGLIFFADALPREEALLLLEGRKKGHEEYLKVLRDIEARPGSNDPDFVDLVLRWGIEFNEWGAQWCEKHLKRLRSPKAA